MNLKNAPSKIPRSAMNTQTHAHELQAARSGIFHSTQSLRHTAYIYIFSQPFPPDQEDVVRHSWNCGTVYSISGVMGNISLRERDL